MSKATLVTGATGNQGGATIRNLATDPSSSDFTLLAVTRNPESPAAQKLVSQYPSVKLVKGDLNNIPALIESAKDVLTKEGKEPKIWGIFSVQTWVGGGKNSYETEIAQGTGLIDEALKHGVKHFVYSSVDRGGNEKSWENATPIHHFQSKYEIENHLRKVAGANGEHMGWTVLRPVAFMDNFNPGFAGRVFLAAFKKTLGDKPVQYVSVGDIGLFAGKVFRSPQDYNAKAIGLAGDELSVDQITQISQKVLVEPLTPTFGFLGSALMWALSDMGNMVRWFKTDGYGIDIAKLRQQEPKLVNFETWLKERSKFPKK